MKVTHFQVFNLKGAFPYVIAKLWILVYEDGVLTSYNYDDIYDNVFSMLENGVMHHLTSVDIVATEIHFPDVFISCVGKEQQQKYIFKKH